MSKIKIFFGKVIALRILVGLARAIRRQIGNTGLGGFNRRPLEKITVFNFCLFSAEGSHFHQPGRVPFSPIRKGPIFTNPEGSQGSPIFTNPEGSHFHQSGRVPFSPIRKGPIFTNPEVGRFPIRRIPFSPIRKGPTFGNPEGSHFHQSGRIRKGPIFTNPEGSFPLIWKVPNPEGSHFPIFLEIQSANP